MASMTISSWTSRCERSHIVSWAFLLIGCAVFGVGGTIVEGTLWTRFFWFLLLAGIVTVHLVRPMRLTWAIVLLSVAACFLASLSVAIGAGSSGAASYWTATALVGFLLLGTWNVQPKAAAQ